MFHFYPSWPLKNLTSMCATGMQVDTADLAAQSAAVAVLKALPELQLMLKDFGSANRDG